MQHISRIADVYNTIRVPQAIDRSKASTDQGKMYKLESAGFERFKMGDDVPRDVLVELFRSVERNWSWTTSDPDVDRQQGIELMLRAKALL